ncbi:MAG: hypothetical protein KAG53_00920 [Endozoicomonadaceae bacterium]|nr:hypothetical protein [Endozoicomonadaceae bacterium]
MKESPQTLISTNWFRGSPLLKSDDKQNELDSGNGLSFSGDIDHSIPEDSLFSAPKTVARTAHSEKAEENQQIKTTAEKVFMHAKFSDVLPSYKSSQRLPEAVIDDTVRKQFVRADEELEKHWQSFQKETRNQRELTEAFERARLNDSRPMNSHPSVLGAVYLINRKECADALIDALEYVELDLKKLLDKERRLLKGINPAQFPDWIRKIQAHRLEVANHLMGSVAAKIPSRVSLSEEE